MTITPSSPNTVAGDWPEDAAHENGNYQCRCFKCGKVFIGHKRRVTCKVCATPETPGNVAEIVRKTALFREGAKRIYDGQGDRADMWFFELWHFLGDVEKALSASSAVTARLSDPVAVHANMLRGTIAKPSFQNIKHLYPEEFSQLSAMIDEPLRYATSFLESYVQKYCNPVPSWKALPDLIGVLTQIDNASTVTGEILARAEVAEARLAEAVEVLKDIEQVNEAEPREPDDADFQFRFLEVKRVVRLALGRVGIQKDNGADQ